MTLQHKQKTLSFDGLNLSYFDSESDSKNTILITHANGYSAACYTYLFRHYGARFRFLALDFSGHGNSDTTLNFKDWNFFRDQILALAEKENLSNITGLGHSMGGAAQLKASRVNPGLYSRLILLDPTFLSVPILLYSALFGVPIAKNAAKRRKTFKDIRQVRKVFRKFSAFSNWREDIYEDYINSCFKTIATGEAELCCSPEAEAKNFSTPNFSSLYNDYGKSLIETHIIIPEEYEVCSPYRAKLVVSGHPKSTLSVIPGLTHFFPFERPDIVINKIDSVFDV